MTVLIRVIATLAFLFFLPVSTSAAGLSQSLQQYFSGSAFQFGYGSGTSTNNPRVELTIHYCASGVYYSSGQSCRPNLIASGYQCTPMQDGGRWQLAVQGGQAALRWHSNISGSGALAIFVRADGAVVDQRGNPFYRAGAAQCR